MAVVSMQEQARNPPPHLCKGPNSFQGELYKEEEKSLQIQSFSPLCRLLLYLGAFVAMEQGGGFVC